MEKTIHQGRNVKRFREMLGLKQEGLAYQLGEDWNQQKISLLEQKEEIDDALLQQLSDQLNVPVDMIKNFDDEAFLSNIQNNHEGSVINAGPTINYNCTFNPFDKIVELYEALVMSEREKVEILQKVLDKK